MNLNRIILRPDGEESFISYPSQKLLDSLPKNEDDSPNLYKLPKDTVRNVILQCLNYSSPKDASGGFMVNLIGQDIVRADKEITLRPKMKEFLVEVLKEQIFKEETDKEGKSVQKGIYKGWVIAQVLDELGEKLEE